MTTGITNPQRAALERVARYLDPSTYLAGGVAVALHLHHRQSRDLDLFTASADPASRAEAIATGEPDTRIVAQSEGTLHLEIAGIPTSWIRYRYPLLSPLEQHEGIPVPIASLRDLMCMKLAAIAGRGAARDFWDLHEIMTGGGVELSAVLGAFGQKYTSHDVGHAVKSLVYFADADAAPFPQGLGDEQWRHIKADFERWTAAL